MKRREFLSRTLTGVASAGVLGASASVGEEKLNQARQKTQAIPEELIFRPLGRTGLKLPIVSMGVMNADNPDLVRKSYELGIRHFDTAAVYMRGRNEEMLGNVFSEMNCRDNVVIATKCLVPSQRNGLGVKEMKEELLKTAGLSLKRLKTDYVDIMYLHDVSTVEEVNLPGVMEALAQLKEEKKVRFVGFSTHKNMDACLDEASRTGFYDVVLTSFNYAHSGHNELLAALKNAASKGIGLVAMKTQCTQNWYREGLPGLLQTYYEGSVMQSAVLKWVLRHEFIATSVPGYTTFEQLEIDFGVASNLAYSPQEKKFLEDRNVKLAMGAYCRQCSECLRTCPRKADIPTLMRVHMYAACYGNFFQARNVLEGMPDTRGLKACGSCADCSARCTSRVPIARRIEELRAIYA